MAGFTFLAPLTLLGLLALPVIWWILRVAPPAPKVQTFPPLQLFADIHTDEETPAKTPIWLLLFRLLMVALVTIALAGPIFTRSAADTQKPLVLVIENNWLAAPFWSEIMDEAEAQIKTARRENVDVALILTNGMTEGIDFAPAQSTLDAMETLKPHAWVSSTEQLVTQIQNFDFTDSETVFLSSGLSFDTQVIDLFSEAKSLSVFSPVGARDVILPVSTQEVSNGFEVTWTRAINSPLPIEETVLAIGADNSVLARADLNFAPGDNQTTARFELPAQLRNRVTHIRLSGDNSAGTIKLLDDSWGRPLIGLMSGIGDTSSPLLSEPFYARTALQPYADIYDGNLDALLDVNPSLIIMPDSQRTDDDRLIEYVETGGILVRFAGEKLAKRPDTLLPVPLRTGGREIGGALSWESPQKLSPFEANSPFFGLDVSDEITVSRQVMAEPGIETDTNSWARLEDGSPVVTASSRGEGMVVLFHVTAGPEWSNLALSGLYVEMLRRILPLAKTRARQAETIEGGDWIANRVLNGFGQFENPGANVKVIPDEDFEKIEASALTPPGFYIQGNRKGVVPTFKEPNQIQAINIPNRATKKQYGGTRLQSLAGIGLAVGLIGLAMDALFALLMSGRRPIFWPQSGRLAALLVACLCLSLHEIDAFAQEGNSEIKEMEAATGLHFAYIKTDNGRVDRLTENGLESLAKQLDVRTTIDVVGVHAVDPAADNLSLYPFLYWIISRDIAAPTDEAVTALNAYMESGGTIVFDTRDAADQAITGNSPHPGLARITSELDIPRLTRVPSDHVLTKSFYLIQSFPGRWANGDVWVDAASNAAGRDGVSPVIIGGNDWASAWALDEDNRPIIDLDESLPRQREFAARFGINLAMYTLAGNYKADQVHTAELVERLGRNAGNAGFPVTPDSRPDNQNGQGQNNE